MASGAGLNRVGTTGGRPLLSIAPNASAVASPLAAYGTVGVNDSGPLLIEAAGYTKWTFQMIGGGATAAGYTVSLYGTIDPALLTFLYSNPGNANYATPQNLTNIVPATSWWLLPGPSEQGGTGTMTNPLISGTATGLLVSGAIVAVRAVLTAVSSPANPVTVLGFVVP